MERPEGTPAAGVSGGTPAKRPYTRPRIVWLERIEARAVACAKQPGNPPCELGPITS